MEAGPYYVYMYWEPDGTPRYVGLSKNPRRWLDHLRKSHNPRLDRKIKRLALVGEEMVRQKVSEGLHKDAAIAEEIRLIALHGRVGVDHGGTLWNHTAGGEGTAELDPSIREAAAAKQRGRPKSAAAIAKSVEARRGMKQSPEAVAKRAATLRGRRNSPDLIERRIAPQRGVKRGPQSPELVEKRIAPLRGRPRSAEVRAKVSAANKGRVRTPEMRAHHSQMMKGKNRGPKSPEHLAAIAAGKARARAAREAAALQTPKDP